MAAFDEETAEARKVRKKRDDAVRLAAIQRSGVIQSLAKSTEGRVFLRWLLFDVGKAIGHQPFRGTAAETDFTCGEVNVGLRIMAELERVDPAIIPALLKENIDGYRELQSVTAASDSEPELALGAADELPESYT